MTNTNVSHNLQCSFLTRAFADIMDKELGAQRKARWETAFKGPINDLSNNSRHGLDFDNDDQGEKHDRDINRKATIVLEHLIQVWLLTGDVVRWLRSTPSSNKRKFPCNRLRMWPTQCSIGTFTGNG
jgi:hypothetical protein